MEEQEIEVVERGKLPLYTIICSECKSLLRFSEKQEIKDWDSFSSVVCNRPLFHYIRCPICEEKIVTRKYSLFYKRDFRKKCE